MSDGMTSTFVPNGGGQRLTQTPYKNYAKISAYSGEATVINSLS